MNPKPLYQRLAEARESARNSRQLAEATPAPVTHHELETSARAADAEAANMAAAIEEAETLLMKLREILKAAAQVKHRGPHLTLAFRHLEDAESRLVRELGTQP